MKILRLFLPLVALTLAFVACDPDSSERFQFTNSSDSTFTVVTKLHTDMYYYNVGEADTTYWLGDTLRVAKYRVPQGKTVDLYYEEVYGSPHFDDDESARYFFEHHVADEVSLEGYTLARHPMVMTNWQRTIKIFRNGEGEVKFNYVVTNSDLSAAK